MQYMLLLYSDAKVFAAMPEASRREAVAAYEAYTAALRAAGALVGSNRLATTESATTVRVRDGKSQVLDGPYAETKEQLGGFYFIDVADLDEALKWAARIPAAITGSIEVRPVMKFE